MANELGLRNVSFEVGDYENSVRMAQVRGPEGIIVSLFEQIGRWLARYGALPRG